MRGCRREGSTAAGTNDRGGAVSGGGKRAARVWDGLSVVGAGGESNGELGANVGGRAREAPDPRVQECSSARCKMQDGGTEARCKMQDARVVRRNAEKGSASRAGPGSGLA
mgnify:CR=1 FL=1